MDHTQSLFAVVGRRVVVIGKAFRDGVLKSGRTDGLRRWLGHDPNSKTVRYKCVVANEVAVLLAAAGVGCDGRGTVCDAAALSNLDDLNCAPAPMRMP